MEKQYSPEVLDVMFKDIKEQLDRIEVQTTKTNGNVSSLKVWRGYITGAIAVIVVVFLPILFYLAEQEMNINNTLTSHIGASESR